MLLALGWWKASQVESEVESAILAGGTVNAHLTGYWPYQAGLSAAERLMEGGTNDRKGRALYTLEMYQRGEAPYVSVAGDYTIWPDGQHIRIDAWPGVVFRVVDTGGHFYGAKKVFRVVGREPLDICVESSRTPITKLAQVAIVAGDNWTGRDVRTGSLAGYSGGLG